MTGVEAKEALVNELPVRVVAGVAKNSGYNRITAIIYKKRPENATVALGRTEAVADGDIMISLELVDSGNRAVVVKCSDAEIISYNNESED